MNITEYIGIGGPVGIGFAVLGFLLNAYLTKRKDDREEIKIERESETGIVETTKQALQMARDEMTAIHMTRIDERARHSEEVNHLRAEVQRLIRENAELRMQLRGYSHEQPLH